MSTNSFAKAGTVFVISHEKCIYFLFLSVLFSLLEQGSWKRQKEKSFFFGIFCRLFWSGRLWIGGTLLGVASCHLTVFLWRVQYAATAATVWHIWVTVAVHLHPQAQCRTHKWQFHLLNTYTQTKVSKPTWSRNHFHTEQENITIQILYACSVWTHHSPGLLSFCYSVTGVFAECKYRATCSLLAWRVHVWTLTREIQAHIHNFTLW